MKRELIFLPPQRTFSTPLSTVIFRKAKLQEKIVVECFSEEFSWEEFAEILFQIAEEIADGIEESEDAGT